MQQISVMKDSILAYRIEPFYFERDFSDIQQLTGFKNHSFTKEMFYKHINNLLYLKNDNPSYNNQIAKSFELDRKYRNGIAYLNSYKNEHIAIPYHGTEFIYVVKKIKDAKTKTVTEKQCIRFKIDNVQIIISEMQVGFVIYDLKILELFDEIHGEKRTRELTVDNYEWAMYFLRKMQTANEGYLNKYIKDPVAEKKLKEYGERVKQAKKNNEPFNEERPPKPEIIEVSVKWSDLTAGLLKELGEVHSFTNKKKVGHHTLLYSSAFVESPIQQSGEKNEFEQELANKAYKISHGYRETYYKEVSEQEIVRPFNNVMWSFSSEGVANIVYSVDDEQTMKFFHNSFKTKRTTNYFFMYILALLQKYSLLYFTIETANILFKSSIYMGEQLLKDKREEELKRTRDFHAKTLKFTIHGYYEQVSYHTHYNDMYEQLIRALRIPELQNEIKPKIEAFHQVIETLVYEQNLKEKEEDEREENARREEELKAREKQNNIIQTITYFLLPASLATGILGMNIPLITNSTDFYLAYTILGVTLITAILSILLKKEKRAIPAKIIIAFSIILLLGFIVLDYYYDPPSQNEEKIEQQHEDAEQTE